MEGGERGERQNLAVINERGSSITTCDIRVLCCSDVLRTWSMIYVCCAVQTC